MVAQPGDDTNTRAAAAMARLAGTCGHDGHIGRGGRRRPPPQPPPPLPPTSDAAEQAWLPANEDGSTPAGHPVKVKESSGIFHVPGGRFYDRTKPDRCYPTAAAAEADGYRRSKT